MQDKAVSKPDSETRTAPRFTFVERVVLVSGAGVLSAWIGGLAWVGYKLMTLII